MSNVDVVHKVYEALDRGDVPAVLGVMDKGIQWREAEHNPYMPSGEPWIGPDAILNNLLTKLASEWDAFTVHPKMFHGAGDAVVVEGRYTGTYKKTGKQLDAQFCHIWHVKDGALTRFQQYVDTAQMRDAVDG